MSTPSDLQQLLDMGFDKEKAEIAVKKTGGLNGALQWLEDNQDKSIEEIRSAEAAAAPESDETNPNIEPAPLKDGEEAKSMVCTDCGKKFRSMMQVQFHAEKTQHENFEQSTEEIAPLTEEEKQQKLAELREKAKEKRAKQALVDREEAKRNEQIRMKSTKEVSDAKEKLAKDQQIKEAQAKRAEKAADVQAKKRIQEKIAADKEERRLKAEAAKALREGRAPPAPAAAPVAAPAASSGAPKVHTESRLRLQTATGVMTKTYPVDTTLFEISQQLEAELGSVTSFTMTYPKKTFEGPVDFGKTLKEAGLIPSAVLIVK
ncbi:putative ubx domain-containing protein [Botrytis fragariae]|uniref:Putative ubx domain-containing protein n=1 Tax=Botrytis fragariae TaxID=1964551 RepID=A0A8H6EES7_9HELO|nr:putative ubx domain-containing protein [Botrytis fragariae]KAF5869699.1 putative ubx domain-containing protein [Botrytis fragariae]